MLSTCLSCSSSSEGVAPGTCSWLQGAETPPSHSTVKGTGGNKESGLWGQARSFHSVTSLRADSRPGLSRAGGDRTAALSLSRAGMLRYHSPPSPQLTHSRSQGVEMSE